MTDVTQREWQPSDDDHQLPATLQEHLAAVWAGLVGLGLTKPGEEARTLHAHGCTYREGTCTCPGGPELVYAEWDERVPGERHYHPTPERFYARH